jgi:hypothetical protein
VKNSSSDKFLVEVRFPNEPFTDKVYMAPSDFSVKKEFSEVVFGDWKGIYISLNKKDYENHIKNG